MNYQIVSGTPTADELAAIEVAMSLHKRKVLEPTISKAGFGRPQLRKPMNIHFRFGRTK
jgi:hypothetical protein